VVIEVEPDRIEVVGGVRRGDPYSNIRKLIERGMRAQLMSESLVTGLLMIELEYHPDSPVRLVGKDTKYPEIPTIPSTLEKMTQKIMDLPIEDLFAKLVKAVDSIASLVASPEIIQIIHKLKGSMDGALRLINNLNAQAEPLASGIKGTLGEYSLLAKNADQQIKPLVSDLRTAVKNYDKLARDIDRHVDPLGNEVDKVVKSATSALKQAEKTIKEIEGTVSVNSVMGKEIQSTLRELSAAARSIRVWADYLERHPEALIRGKGEYRR
jgi:paraquat-inducible protein B